MRLPFLDRQAELARLRKSLASRDGGLICLYGRRRLGKSRLLQRLLERRRGVYYVGDDRDAAVQRQALAREMARVLPGFAAVAYPGWWELLERWWREAPSGAVLTLDELPALVATSRELPSLLQKLLDSPPAGPRQVVLCGSSQRMMHGLALDSAAPLYGRAREIVRLEPLAPRWARRAFRLRSAAEAIERYAIWGGVPRYWELAAEQRDFWRGVEDLVLDPLGVLHDEPARLLLDELGDVVRPASVLAMIGQGCHRLSEIAGRLGLPATSLSRPLALLVELGFIRREIPFGASPRDTKRSLYRIADPLLDFFNRFVEPNRSRLGAGQHRAVRRDIQAGWPRFLGQRWEQIVRERVARAPLRGTTWLPPARWWGTGTDGRPLELDALSAAADDPDRVLLIEAKLTADARSTPAHLQALRAKAALCPALTGKRVEPLLWALRRTGRSAPSLLGPEEVLAP